MHKHALLRSIAIAAALVATSASAAPRSGAATPPPYAIDMHSIGSGGVSSSDDYRLEGTTGQWSVNVVKLEDASGFALEGGIWPGLSLRDCSSAEASFTTDLSACH